MSDIKHISAREFLDGGYLQEANRLFFHPLGLALEITIDVDDLKDAGRFSGVWDYREDPEGMEFGGEENYGLDASKADAVERERLSHEPARKKLWGQVVQPLFEDLDKRVTR